MAGRLRNRGRFRFHRRRRQFDRLKATCEYKQYLKDRDKLRCEICGYFDPLLLPYFGLEVHHVRPASMGGGEAFGNFIACCPNHHSIADRYSRKNPKISRVDLIEMIRWHDQQRGDFRAMA